VLLLTAAYIAGARQGLHDHPVNVGQSHELSRGWSSPTRERFASPEVYREAVWAVSRRGQ
jgi:hypothetical protein